MTITPAVLTRAAGAAAVAAGAIFIAVNIKHPDLNASSVTTTNVYVRDQLKVLMSVLALVGITGMYLSQIRRHGVLGLIGYAILAVGYLGIMTVTFIAAYVLPEVVGSNRVFVNDVIAINTSHGTVVGDIGALHTVIQLQGFAYLAGGILFGIALYRAHVLARWAAVVLAIGGLAPLALPLMPDGYYRYLSYPNGIAMIGLGCSLWYTTRISATTEQSAVTIPAPRTHSSSMDSLNATAEVPPLSTHGRRVVDHESSSS
jgi:hypothetical protein